MTPEEREALIKAGRIARNGICSHCGTPLGGGLRIFCKMCRTIREVEANAAADHFWTRKHPPQEWDHDRHD